MNHTQLRDAALELAGGPHLLIVAAFTGGGWTWRAPSAAVTNGLDDGWTGYGPTGGPSLIGLLVLVAAVILLFTGRYRRALFDLIMASTGGRSG